MSPGTFRLIVSCPRTARQAFDFDVDELVVGRGRDAGLSIEQENVSARQLVVRRQETGLNEYEFWADALPATNATRLRGAVVSSWPLRSGDRLQVGPVAIRFEAGASASRVPRGVGKPLLYAAAAVGLLVLWLLPDVQTPEQARPPTLFPPVATPVCPPEPAACLEQIRSESARAEELQARGEVDPAALYQAARALEKAVGQMRVGHVAAASVPGLENRLETLRWRAEQRFADSWFRLRRARETNDRAGQIRELTFQEQLVADPTHPYRAWVRAQLDELGEEKEPNALKELGL